MVIDREKLAKICQMLTSSHDGERAVAARMASEMLKKADMTWDELVAQAFETPPPRREGEVKPRPTRMMYFDGHNVQEVLFMLNDESPEYSDWEDQFVTSLLDQCEAYGGCTIKQWIHLKRIAEKFDVI